MNKIVWFLSGICLLCFSCSKNETFVEFTYPEGKYKALIMSYDDGVIEDIQLAKLFDKHNIVGTFNLNSAYIGKTRAWPQKDADTIFQKYVPKDSLLITYKNHEIAAHGALHKDFIKVSLNEVFEEVTTDIKTLEKLTDRKVISMAYPFGNTNDSIAKLIKTTGITNARTVADTYTFNLPEDYLMWNPTCHDSKVLDYADSYFKLDKKELSLFYVWGHSWEFGNEDRWNNIVAFCKEIGSKDNIWSVGAGEYITYLKALSKVEESENYIINPKGNHDIWIETSAGIKILKSGETISK